MYLYREDRWQVNNLATEVKHEDALKEHRQQLEKWIVRTGDPGPESPEVYILETEDQMKSYKSKDHPYRRNAELYKQWAKEGK